MCYKPYVLWILSGLCLGLAFIHPILSPLAIIGLAIFINLVVASENVRFVLVGSYVVGLFKYAGAIIWFWNSYPLTWLGLSPGYSQLALIGAVWAINVIFLAISTMLCGLLLRRFYHRHQNYLLLFPLLLVATEIFGSFIFSIYTLGPGSQLNIDFSFGYVGYAISQIPGFLPLAISGGVYALSVFGGFLALAFYLLWLKKSSQRKNYQAVLPIILILWLGASHVWLYLRNEHELDKEIIAVSTRFDSLLLSTDSGRDTKRAEVEEAVRLALALDPDILLLPEDSRFVSSFETEKEIFEHLHEEAPDSQALLVDSSRATLNDEEVALRAYVFDLASDQLHAVDKQKLVPQGEYLPYLFSLWFEATADDRQLVEKILHDRSYRPGPVTGYQGAGNELPGILFCFESVMPVGVSNIMRHQGDSLILHPVSHGWFNDSSIMRAQLDRMLRIQALWNNANIVQAGNMAPTLLYKPDGTIDNGKLLEERQYFTLYLFK